MLQCSNAAGSLRNIPSPEQGASASTASKKPLSSLHSGPAAQEETTALVTPHRSRFCCRAAVRQRTYSLHHSKPRPSRQAAIWVDFPPGAAQRSSTRSPDLGASAVTADMAEGSCI